MSARRYYTIECDGPNCVGFITTDKSFVSQAREEADAEGWHKTGAPMERALDFCAPTCEIDYRSANPPRKVRWPHEARNVDA